MVYWGSGLKRKLLAPGGLQYQDVGWAQCSFLRASFVTPLGPAYTAVFRTKCLCKAGRWHFPEPHTLGADEFTVYISIYIPGFWRAIQANLGLSWACGLTFKTSQQKYNLMPCLQLQCIEKCKKIWNNMRMVCQHVLTAKRLQRAKNAGICVLIPTCIFCSNWCFPDEIQSLATSRTLQTQFVKPWRNKLCWDELSIRRSTSVANSTTVTTVT